MDAIKRASFASKQVRAGPAPLASFEDLPSDELESPEEIAENPIYRSNAIEDESGNSDTYLTTPDSLTISSQSTPRIECDFDSHFTLTPSEPYEGQSSSELRTISLSSLSKETTLNVIPKKGSAVSLGTIETPEPEYTQRKSSWTDIFRGHNQNVKNSSVTPTHETSNDKSTKKKTDAPSKDQGETKSKEKGKFLSFFKKKSNKSASSLISPDGLVPNETVNEKETEENIQPKITNGSVHKVIDKDLVLSKDFDKVVQNDLGKVNIERNDQIPDERKINRKLINICENSVEKELNNLSLPELKQLDKVSKTENIQAIVHNIDHESSESELAFEVKDTTISEAEKKEDDIDYEAETLLTPDISEIEEDQIIDLQPVSYEVSKQIMIPSRQQRLEVTTKPIDRPRSTTPINASSLEAFIRSASPTSQANVEKIKLSLPGEQFLGRVKSPKKSVKSWSDFCEKGLSPRMYKRIDSDDIECLFSPFEGVSLDTAIFSDSKLGFPKNNPPFTDSKIPFTDSNPPFTESNAPFTESNPSFSDPNPPFSYSNPPFSYSNPPFSYSNPPFSDSNPPFFDSSADWGAFELDSKGFDSNRFSDNFSTSVKEFECSTELNEQIPQRLTDPYQPFETNFFSCSCDCHKQDQRDSGPVPREDTNSKICSCQCQFENKEFNKFKTDFSNENLPNCDVANEDSVVSK